MKLYANGRVKHDGKTYEDGDPVDEADSKRAEKLFSGGAFRRTRKADGSGDEEQAASDAGAMRTAAPVPQQGHVGGAASAELRESAGAPTPEDPRTPADKLAGVPAPEVPKGTAAAGGTTAADAAAAAAKTTAKSGK